jgi:hypothetical protein
MTQSRFAGYCNARGVSRQNGVASATCHWSAEPPLCKVVIRPQLGGRSPSFVLGEASKKVQRIGTSWPQQAEGRGGVLS